MNAALALLRRDLRLAFRSGGGAGLGISFFVIVVFMAPFGIGPDPQRLAPVAPGILWIGALLACLLSLDRMFQTDHDDGTLEVLAVSPLPLELVVAIKSLAHWLTSGLPLVLVSPLLAIALHLPNSAFGTLVLALAIGTPGLSFLGAIGGAVTVGTRRGGLLLSILVLPLYIPTLIFGAKAVVLAAEQSDPRTALIFLIGLSLFIVAAAPFAGAAALRVNLR